MAATSRPARPKRSPEGARDEQDNRLRPRRLGHLGADSGEGSHAGHHHYLPLGLVADVEGDSVRLSASGENAVLFEEEKDSSSRW